MKDYADKELRIEDRRAAKLVQGYDQGYTLCSKCRFRMDFTNCVPLSMEQCPKCGDLVFVPVEIEGWWITRPLGAGGFGSVYLGRHRENPEIKAAVKVLQRAEHINDEILESFMREAEIGYSFGQHPNLAQIYSYGYLEDNAFMIMEFIEGIRLIEYTASRGGKIPIEETLYYLLDLVSALEFVYDNGYLYRDMKPENIIIRKDNGLATIIDYGLTATFDKAIEDAKGPIIGSALFMPPERYLRLGEDHRGDIYSLGMVLYYTVMGSYFFSRTEIKTVARGHTRRLRIKTKSRMPDCDENLVELVDMMIRRNREERVQTYEELRGLIYGVLGQYQERSSKDPVIQRRRQHFIHTYGHIEYE
jgi:serine/threonine protein kinase